MDVVKPELYWVQDRCYRRNPSRNDYRTEIPNTSENEITAEAPRDQAPYQEYDEYSCDPDAPDEEEDNEKYVLEKIENGFKGKATTVPSAFFSFIIGAKGATKKRLETETNTKIIIPRINEKGHIVVRGSKRRDVLHALRRLDLMCTQARAKRDITHFACYPLNEPAVIANFAHFREKVLAEFGGSPGNGIGDTIFQEAEKLHLTIAVMTLLDPQERDNVAKLLQSLGPDVRNLSGNKALKVNLKGLQIMNDDPSDVHVLYAKCELEDDRVQNIADLVANRLASSGYTRDNKGNRVKLHATLMNSRFRGESSEKRQEGGQGRGGQERESFDARKILEKYGEFEFGTVEVKEILIVTRYTKDKNGFYCTMAKIQLS